MPTREEITYILVHDRLPNHPKIKVLTDAEFRLLIEAWCHCGEYVTDGKIPADLWKTMRTKKARDGLIERGLALVTDKGDVEMHDWLDIQRSSVEVEAARAKKSAGGTLGNHRRHHVAKRIVNPDCKYCLKGAVA
jgi:hypothetical protein